MSKTIKCGGCDKELDSMIRIYSIESKKVRLSFDLCDNDKGCEKELMRTHGRMINDYLFGSEPTWDETKLPFRATSKL